MDDYLACSDLCEEQGFLRQAELLRAVGRGQGRAFLVLERGYHYNDYNYDLDRQGQPRTVFLDRDHRVVGVKHELKPWRVAGAKGAYATLELPAGAAAEAGIEEGDVLVLEALES